AKGFLSIFVDRILPQQAARDHQSLELVCSAADDQERGVAIVSLYWKVFRITVAAENSHRFKRAFLRGFGREQLRHPGFKIATLTAIFFRRGSVDEQGRGFDLCSHICQLQLDRLMIANRFPEGPPLL